MIENFWIINKYNECRLIKNYIINTDIKYENILNLIHYNEKQNINYVKLNENKIVVFKKFASLYIIIICDNYESILAILDIIEIYINSLSQIFDNVRELDIKLHPEECLLLLDQIIVGGVVITTEIKTIVENYKSYISQEGLAAKSYFGIKNFLMSK